MKILFLILILAVYGTIEAQSLLERNPSLKTESGDKEFMKQINDQVEVNYTYIRNLGRFGEIYKYGSGVTLSYGKYFPISFLAVARTGFMSHEIREGVDSGFTDFKVYPLHIGGRYYVYKNIILPYFSFMTGINVISSSNYLAGGRNDQTLGRYAWQLGFGFDLKFVKNLAVNFNANYNNCFYETGSTFDNEPAEMMTGLEYSAGVSYNFGK